MTDMILKYRPIFDLELGWIRPIGGAEGEGQTDEEKKAAEEAAKKDEEEAAKKAEEEAAAKKAEEEAAAKKAEEEGGGEDDPDPRDKEIEDLKAANKAHEEAEKKRQRDAMTETERLKAEKKESDDKLEEEKQKRIDAEVQTEIQKEIAVLAQKGVVLPAEFVPQVKNAEDVVKAFEAAAKRWETVQEDVRKGKKTNLPGGAQGGSSGGGRVPADKIERFKTLTALLKKENSIKHQREWSQMRRNLINDGVDVGKIAAEAAGTSG